MNLKDLNDVFENKYSLTESFKRLNEEDEFDDEVVEENEIPEGMKQVCLSICVNIPEEMAEEDICDFFINDFSFDAEPFEDCEIAKVECSVEDEAEDEEFAEEEIEEPEDFEESLDEGILDKLKGGLNSLRTKANSGAASKRYAAGNFAGGAEARMGQANAVAARANNRADADKNLSVVDRSLAKGKAEADRQENIKAAGQERKNAIQEYLNGLYAEIEQIADANDLKAAYKGIYDDFAKKNSSDPKLIRAAMGALKKRVDAQAERIKNGEVQANPDADADYQFD